MSTPYIPTTNQDEEYVYKKTIGVSYEYPGSAVSSEYISSLPFIINSQIMTNNIPATAPDISGNGTPVSSGGGTRYTTTDADIIYYYRIPLNVQPKTGFSYVYSNVDQSSNLTTQSIPSTYDPLGSYNINVEYSIVSGSGSTTFSSISSDMTYIFDNTTGCITFTTSQWTSLYNNPPYITFFRYEGPFGVSSSGSSQWSTISNNNIYYSSGNVGIGSSNNPTHTLEVAGNAYISQTLDVSGNENISGILTVNGNTYLSTTTGNMVGIGTTSPSHTLDVSGNAYILQTLDVSGNVNISGTLTCQSATTTSDYRIKKEIKQIHDTSAIDKLNPVIYKLKTNDQIQAGFIAHELQEYYPFLVEGIKDGAIMQSINYSGLIPILVKEIQELKKQINELKKFYKI
jgi:hypothetical protein